MACWMYQVHVGCINDGLDVLAQCRMYYEWMHHTDVQVLYSTAFSLSQKSRFYRPFVGRYHNRIYCVFSRSNLPGSFCCGCTGVMSSEQLLQDNDEADMANAVLHIDRPVGWRNVVGVCACV